jgi:GTPase Era involved in 16S rRNA processing
MEMLDDLIDLNGNLELIESLVRKHELSDENTDEIERRLKEIRDKQEDKNLNLSVIGEFSTGKSTFINALIRADILESDILQGTTVAATVIRYGHKRNILIKRIVEGREKLYEIEEEKIKDHASFVRSVTEATTKKSDTSKKETVIIEYPSETLKENLVIVDTPGTNVTEVWHEEITSHAIHTLSDASIIVVDAIKPMPISLVTFINSNLQAVIKNCVFVVNRIDLLKPKERDRVIHYIRESVSKTFDIEHPIVCPYTALFVLGKHVPELIRDVQHDADDMKQLIEQAYETEKTIYSYLAERRLIIQRTKLLDLMDHTLGALEEGLKQKLKYYERKHEEIEASKIKDLDRFIQEKINQVSDEISIRCMEEKKKFYQSGFDSRKEWIRYNLFALEDRKYLTAYVNHLPNNLQKAARETFDREIAPILERMNQFEEEQWSIFFEDFKAQYHRLAIHGNREEFKVEISTPQYKPILSTGLSASLAEASSKYQKISEAANYGGAAGGAVLGQLIIPVPVVGAALGLLAGWTFGDKIGMPVKKMKADYWAKMEPMINQYFNTVMPEFISYLHQYQSAIIEQFRQKVLSCKEKYSELIKEIDRQDNEYQMQLRDNQTMVRQDLKILENRKDNIKSTMGLASKL